MTTMQMNQLDHYMNSVWGTTGRGIVLHVWCWMMLGTCILHGYSVGASPAFDVETSSSPLSTTHGRISEASSLSVPVSTSALNEKNCVDVDHDHHHHLGHTHDHHDHHHGLGRGKRIQTPIDPSDLFAAYKEIQQEYQSIAFNPSVPWKVLNRRDEDDMEVALLEHADDPTCPYVRLKGRFPVPVSDCWNFLRVSAWDRTMPQMDPFYEGVSVHGEYEHESSQMILCRKRTKRIFTFGKRDLVFLSVADETPLSDGTRVSGTVSVITDLVPRQPGYVRAFQDSIGFYKPVNNNTETELTIVCRIDLNDSGENGSGGFIPMWVYVRTIGRTGLQSVIRMGHALVHERLRQQQQQLQQHDADDSGTANQ